MANKIYYSKILLTGGGATALDSIDGAGLVDGDFATVTISKALYLYKLNATLGGAESSPNLILPDTNPGTKVWVLQGLVQAPQATGFSLTGGTTPKTLTVTGDATISATPAGDIPSGTKMLFYADTAPTGWTIDNTLNDKVVYVTKGSAAGGQTGGGVHSAGTWTQPNHVHAGPSHMHTTAAMTLATTQIPAHTHAMTTYTTGAGSGAIVEPQTNSTTLFYTNSTGGGQSHEHGATGSGGTESTGNGATANTWRPAAYCVIICSKN